ncbi:hypothetical protein CMI40_00720 [Candidatus Pacearchaeota archaeon]|jgi:hypothetical protein|nr:hypothetical protein [Candidatus Pacearchaeota archaeon]|tara:strand:- start:12188 stop:12379 length:192 start_codon:yes stop_codon:yes gene_type:complete
MISSDVKEYLDNNKGLNLEVLDVKNIGSLPLEERNRIKREHYTRLEKNRPKVLQELRDKYGPV